MSLRALAVVGAAVVLAACLSAATRPPELDTPEQRFSYSVGAKYGEELRRSNPTIDPELAARGLEDGLAGRIALSESDVSAALEEGVRRQLERQTAAREERALAAQQEGRAFLAANRERPGVVELPSGLQYEVLREGSGAVPTVEDFVTCEYRASLLDGTVFDDTASLGRPRTFAVTSVIDGFEEALKRMPVGARWKIYVPAELGYGAKGARVKVPPYATLIFEVDLVSISAPPRP